MVVARAVVALQVVDGAVVCISRTGTLVAVVAGVLGSGWRGVVDVVLFWPRRRQCVPWVDAEEMVLEGVLFGWKKVSWW